MKKMIMMALLTISTVSFALPKEGKVANRAESRTFLDNREEYKRYKHALENKSMSPEIKQAFTKFLNDSLTGISGVDALGLESLVRISTDSASKIIELITLAKNGTVEQKMKATSDLKIMADGAKLLDSSSATVKDEAKALEQIADMADYNKNAKTFKADLAIELQKGGITVTEAISKASKGKITLEKIKDCMI